jgi:quinol monooxygenase YgiN
MGVSSRRSVLFRPTVKDATPSEPVQSDQDRLFEIRNPVWSASRRASAVAVAVAATMVDELATPPNPRKGKWIMVTVGILATLTAKPGKEGEVAEFLASALPLAEAEPETTAWFAIKIDDSTYGIFDVFPSSDGRQAHLAGPIASALTARAGDLFSEPPSIKPIDVLAAKLPG